MAKTGRKPIGETAKIAYSTKLPEEQVIFLRSLPNAAAWLSAAIRMYGAWMEEFKKPPACSYDAEFHQVERRLPPELEGDAEPINSPHWGVLEIGEDVAERHAAIARMGEHARTADRREARAAWEKEP